MRFYRLIAVFTLDIQYIIVINMYNSPHCGNIAVLPMDLLLIKLSMIRAYYLLEICPFLFIKSSPELCV